MLIVRQSANSNWKGSVSRGLVDELPRNLYLGCEKTRKILCKIVGGLRFEMDAAGLSAHQPAQYWGLLLNSVHTSYLD